MEKLTARRTVLEKVLATLAKSLAKLERKECDDYQELRDSILPRHALPLPDASSRRLRLWRTGRANPSTSSGRTGEGKASVPFVASRHCKCRLEAWTSEEIWWLSCFPKIGLQSPVSIGEFSICNKLIEDRNLTSHGYNEMLAEKISLVIPTYYAVMHGVLERLRS